MSELMTKYYAYRRERLVQNMDELQKLLPSGFFIVECLVYPEGYTRPKTKFICETREEAEKWIKEKVQLPLQREEDPQGTRIWVKVWKQKTGKKPKVLEGICFKIKPSDPDQLAMRLFDFE